MNRMNQPSTGILAFLTGGSVSITEIVTSGSLWLTFLGALLAFLGGLWTIRAARIQYAAAQLDLKTKEMEFLRAQKDEK